MIAYRSLDKRILRTRAITLFKKILETLSSGGRLSQFHKGKLQQGEFLEDYAVLLLYATYIYEETEI